MIPPNPALRTYRFWWSPCSDGSKGSRPEPSINGLVQNRRNALRRPKPRRLPRHRGNGMSRGIFIHPYAANQGNAPLDMNIDPEEAPGPSAVLSRGIVPAAEPTGTPP